MDRQNFKLQVKALNEDGTFTGIGAVFNNVDLGGDKILPGAFQTTLAKGKTYPLLWQHDPSQPIGSFTAKETQLGLAIDGKLELEDPTALKAYRFLKKGIIKGLSIGYDTVKAAMNGDVRELSELRLWELSVVTFPMNTEAMVTSIKAMSDEDRAKHFKTIDAHRRSIDKHQRAIRESLKCLFDGLDDEPAADPEVDQPTAAELEEMSMVYAEIKSLAEQVRDFI